MNSKDQYSIVFIAFAVLCFGTSFVFNLNKGPALKMVLPPEGGIVGPINVSQAKTVYNIRVKQDISRDFENSFLSGELLDENQEYLFGFGKELYRESGYDSDGYWSEKVTKYNMKVTIPEKGKYFLGFETERSSQVNSQISVKVEKKVASALPLFTAGILALIAGVIIFCFSHPEIFGHDD